MADLSKCCGICIKMVPTSVIGITEEAEVHCPERDSCFRYICKAHENQSWIAPDYNFATNKCENQIQQISRECGCGQPGCSYTIDAKELSEMKEKARNRKRHDN